MSVGFEETVGNGRETGSAGERPAPLGLVLLLTFLGSMGTGAVTNGIYFITNSALHYGRRENLWLGVALGVTYLGGAAFAGSMLRLVRRSPKVSTRAVMAGILALMGVACLVPLAAQYLAPTLLGPAVWALVLVYSPATGVLWPVVESYLSGGRSGRALRFAVGRFNIVWSSALVAAFWAMSPLLASRPFWILAGLGMIHLGMVAMAFALPTEPAKHGEAHEPHPPVYERLLALCRVLMFASYLVLSAAGPVLPIILDRLGAGSAAQPRLASAWLIARVGVFALFERWHGWHGRWWAPWAGLGAMVAGFAMTVGAPALGSGGVGLGVFLVGLTLMGAGVAAVYCGALYYALAAGAAEVDAGGRHEAVIGMGYTGGPALGLAALALAGMGGTGGEAEAFRLWSIALIGLSAGVTGLWGWRVASRRG